MKEPRLLPFSRRLERERLNGERTRFCGPLALHDGELEPIDSIPAS